MRFLRCIFIVCLCGLILFPPTNAYGGEQVSGEFNPDTDICIALKGWPNIIFFVQGSIILMKLDNESGQCDATIRYLEEECKKYTDNDEKQCLNNRIIKSREWQRKDLGDRYQLHCDIEVYNDQYCSEPSQSSDVFVPTISGIVKKANSIKVISGAKVQVVGRELFTETDSTGAFTLLDVNDDANVTISFDNCEDVTKKASDLHNAEVLLTCTESADSNPGSGGNQECAIGVKDSFGYYICQADTDCTKEKNTIPTNAKTGKCQNVGRKCSVCVAKECNDGFTKSQGYCVTVAEQGCIDTNGSWTSRTKQCDCGDLKWDTQQNKCVSEEPTEENPNEDFIASCVETGGTPDEEGVCKCEETKGLKPDPDDAHKCICAEEGKQYDATNGICIAPTSEVDGTELCGGGILNEDGTCNCEVEGTHLVLKNGTCECIDGYYRNTDTNECVEVVNPNAETPAGNLNNTSDGGETNDDANQPTKPTKLEQAEDTYQKAKDKEQSLKNRTLTATSTAATGLGMMTMASAKAEQKADEEAEQDMKAYLATFKCEYGRGQSVKASEEEITLPGGNELVNYYQEYKALADNLKNTKKALGLRAGIESEVVYDKAESNLYKYSSVGKTDGAFTSLSRALTDSEGEDAAAWNTQKEETAKKVKTGTLAAGGGILGGVAGDAAMNTDMIQNIANKFKK